MCVLLDEDCTNTYQATNVCNVTAHNIKYSSELSIQLSVQELLDYMNYKSVEYKDSARVEVILNWVVDNHFSLKENYLHTTGKLGINYLEKEKVER
ncbi:unnamed protein product [Linum trigynum]|uniref:Uncharacterized protein n=1 Tax=Linum trigynum TaxID=586398 RepID=A0AAV2GPT3_9ROSI